MKLEASSRQLFDRLGQYDVERLGVEISEQDPLPARGFLIFGNPPVLLLCPLGVGYPCNATGDMSER